MPLNRRNTKEIAQKVRNGHDLQVLTLYKRGDDQAQGTVVTHKLFRCWRDEIVKSGQTLRGQMAVNTATTWHIPRTELTRCGVAHLNATDVFHDPVDDTWWTPYASNVITETLFGNVVDVTCKMTDPK